MKSTFFLILLLLCTNLFSQVILHPRYHTYAEIKAEIDSLQEQYPQFVMVDSIGHTLGADPYQEPLPIWAVKISDNVTVDEDEPAVMFAGQCHAEEVLGVEITMYMIKDIAEHFYQFPYNLWIANLEMWFVPSYNPEGLQVVMDGWDTSFRKNKRDNNLNGIFDYEEGPGNDADGVDTNRNYSFNWCHGDTLWAPGGEELWDYYKGPAPFSEGGTMTIRDLAAEQHFIFSINWHSSRTGNFSEKVYYSFEWDGEKRSPDFYLNQYIGNTVAGMIERENGGYYVPSPSLGRKGNAHDWFYQAHGTTQLLIECGTENLQPPNDPPLYLVDDTCLRCSQGAYWLLDRAIGYETDNAMLTGHVTDANTGEPLIAEILVQQHQASFFAHRLTDELYGRFWRVLLPGTYDLKVRKKGYEEQIINDITVNNSVWTTLEIELVPLDEISVTGTITCNDEPVPAEIIVFSLENDTLYTNTGEFSYDGSAGNFKMQVISNNCVPYLYEEILESGNHDLEIALNLETVIFSESWNNGFARWDVSGDWAIEFDTFENSNVVTNNYGFFEQSYHKFYPNNSISILTTSEPIDLHEASNDIVLKFDHKYYTEHDSDICAVAISINGTDWDILEEFSGINPAWYYLPHAQSDRSVIPLAGYIDNNIYLRFDFSSDETLRDPGWWIDDIKISATEGISDSNEFDIEPYYSKLYNNFPNPFHTFTNISFDLYAEDTKNAEIIIYNLKGQRVKTLECINHVNAKKTRSSNSIIWDGTDDENKAVSSGIYFYQLKTENYQRTKKMILMR